MEGNPDRTALKSSRTAQREPVWPVDRHVRDDHYLVMPEPFDMSPQGDWDPIFHRVYAGLPIRGRSL